MFMAWLRFPAIVRHPARAALDMHQGGCAAAGQHLIVPLRILQEHTMYKRILVPVDGSNTSTKALTAALQLARDSGGRVRLLTSVPALRPGMKLMPGG
jgi:hypothetical protein